MRARSRSNGSKMNSGYNGIGNNHTHTHTHTHTHAHTHTHTLASTPFAAALMRMLFKWPHTVTACALPHRDSEELQLMSRSIEGVDLSTDA